MTESGFLSAVYRWVDFTLHVDKSIGSCKFTNGSDEVTGTGFTGAGLIAGGKVKLDADGIWMVIHTVVSNTKLKLTAVYTGTGGTGSAFYSTRTFRTVIFGEQNAPRPSGSFLVIHRPLSARTIGKDNGAYYNADVSSHVQPYEATVTIESVADTSDVLQTLLHSANFQDVKDYMKSLGLALMRNENIQPIPDMTEDFYEMRSYVDVYFCYSTKVSETTYYIDDVTLTNNIL